MSDFISHYSCMNFQFELNGMLPDILAYPELPKSPGDNVCLEGYHYIGFENIPTSIKSTSSDIESSKLAEHIPHDNTNTFQKVINILKKYNPHLCAQPMPDEKMSLVLNALVAIESDCKSSILDIINHAIFKNTISGLEYEIFRLSQELNTVDENNEAEHKKIKTEVKSLIRDSYGMKLGGLIFSSVSIIAILALSKLYLSISDDMQA